MMYQLLSGLGFGIILSLIVVFQQPVTNFLGKTAYTVLESLLTIFVYIQPPLTTITQAQEWDSIVTIIDNQRNETIEETFDKMCKEKYKKELRLLEKK